MPKHAVRKAAQSNLSLDPGCGGLVRFLASTMKVPTGDKRIGRWMQFSNYIFAFYPDNAFDEKPFRAREGYAGSSKDHFYSNNETGNCLSTRNSWCGCAACLSDPNLWSPHCQWRGLVGRTRHYQLQPAVPAAARPRPARLHTMSFEEYCSNLYDPRLPAKQKVVAVLRHEDDVDPDPAPYYLCRIVCAPWQLPEDCLVARRSRCS